MSSSLSTLPPDLIGQILSRLDGPSLASASASSSLLHSTALSLSLWKNISLSLWPSIAPLQPLISSYHSFFSSSFPLLSPSPSSSISPVPLSPSETIAAVDLFHNTKPIFSKTLTSSTPDSPWFLNSPFSIQALDSTDPQPVIEFSGHLFGEICRDLEDSLGLSWILIDGVTKKSANLSSWKPLVVSRQWFSEGEFIARFGCVVLRDGVKASLCCVVVRMESFLEREKVGVKVKEVSLQVEEMGGGCLNGREGLEVLGAALGSERKSGFKEVKRVYEDFVRLEREMKEKKVRTEVRVDMGCVMSGILAFAIFWVFLFSR
ncbi:hypothetical protein AMTR_s00114p00120290 [Amborella trichopoda]|uniref:F-box domain-containing protein n=2 Tax=Amborella trichopoda TaxID=13333 RepID=W1NTS6_AMBTC|nr:hypothetical protein AMTR_s00114p00120290 [Amborella trichopoda]